MKFVGVAKDRRVFLIVGRRDVRDLGTYDWGRHPPTQPMRDLAKRIVVELTGDAALAERCYMRFMYHTIGAIKPDADWQHDDSFLRHALASIEQDNADNARIRAMVTREIPRGAWAGVEQSQIPGKSAGYGGNDSAPDRRRK